MSALNTAALLTAWEETASEPPVRRAISLLAAARPETPAAAWARMQIGLRDAALLDLQDRLFGSGLEAAAVCPACGERVELAFTTSQIRTPTVPGERVKVHRDGYEVECRLPNSEDLLELAGIAAGPAAQALLGRCVEHAIREGRQVEAGDLPPEVLQEIAEEIAQADPQAEVRVAIECPACAHGWSMDFDIASYLWTEVEDWAHRLLRDIHVLASAYGWSERDVLAMSSRRRRFYLEMVEG